ncbi:MAG: hypothetical protein R3206_04825 [Salegentibacter mishustinae]|nr:hypothetical protein [Salegentibacter mishustinae]
MSRSFIYHLQLVIVALGAVISQLLIKKAMKEGGAIPFTLSGVTNYIKVIFTTPNLILGYSIAAFSAFIWLFALSRMELSYAAPVLNAIYFIVLLMASAMVLGESVSLLRWGGTALIIIGMLLITLDK